MESETCTPSSANETPPRAVRSGWARHVEIAHYVRVTAFQEEARAIQLAAEEEGWHTTVRRRPPRRTLLREPTGGERWAFFPARWVVAVWCLDPNEYARLEAAVERAFPPNE